MTTPDQQTINAIERRAEDIVYETSLTDKQAIVLAGIDLGASDEAIGLTIGRDDATVERLKRQLRQRRREVGDEISELRREKELLDETL